MTLTDPYLIHEWTVRDCRRMLDFYVEAFGAVETHREHLPDGRLAAAEVAAGRYLIRLREEAPARGPRPTRGVPASWCRPALPLSLEDAVDRIPRIIAAGGRIEIDDRDRPPAAPEFVVHDPSGQRWILAP